MKQVELSNEAFKVISSWREDECEAFTATKSNIADAMGVIAKLVSIMNIEEDDLFSPYKEGLINAMGVIGEYNEMINKCVSCR